MRQSLVDLRGRSANQGQMPCLRWLIVPQRGPKRVKSDNIKNDGMPLKRVWVFSLILGSRLVWDVICHHSTYHWQRALAFRMACSAGHIKEIT